jgi:hypothetical protein
MSRVKSFFVVFSLCSALAPRAGTAVAAELKPQSSVAEVTVYRDAALVAREARVTLPPGSHRVVLEGIPCVADPDSVRVIGTGPSGIEIGGVEVRQEFRQPALTPEYLKTRRNLEDLERQQALIEDRLQSIGTLREFLAGLKSSTGQEVSKNVLTKGFAVPSWQQAFDFFSARLDALSEEGRGLEAKKKDLAQKSDVARGTLEQMNSQGGIARWTVAVLVSAARGGDVTLRLSYLAANATWQPLYDARLDTAAEKVSLSWMAQIRQTTGEDWKDVAVTLATTRPSAGIDLPVLASLDLRLLQAAAARGGVLNSEYIDSLPIIGRHYQDALSLAPGGSDVNGDGMPTIRGSRDTDVIQLNDSAGVAAVRVAQALASRREVAVTFSLPGRMDIPSDGQPHKHLIATREMEAKVEHRAVPQLVPAVFLVATVTLPGDVPLLPGRVQHFVGGDLVGGSSMTERAAGEEVSLSFGPDDRLKAERKQLQKKVERRGKDEEVAYRFVTTLENHLGKDGLIEVKDRIPVSGDERIVVTLDDDETTPGALTDEKEPGVLTWKVPVAKGGKKEIALVYRVRAPRAVVLAGLE